MTTESGKNLTALANELSSSSASSLVSSRVGAIVKDIGVTKCIVCAEPEKRQHDSYFQRIPSEFLKDYEILKPEILQKGVFGHKNCYTTIDMYFRLSEKETKKIGCANCNSFVHSWADGDLQEERCFHFDEKYFSKSGDIANNDACNFYSVTFASNLVNPSVHPSLVATWEAVKPVVQARTEKGYQNLLGLLEQAEIIKKKSV